MIEIHSLVSDIKLETSDLIKVLKYLNDNEWTPALYNTQKHLISLFEIDENYNLAFRARRIRMKDMNFYPGDLFYKGNDIYYLTILSSERYNMDRIGTYYFYEDEPEKEELEIGLITSDNVHNQERLLSFADKVKEAIMASIDGRKTRNMKFDWIQNRVGTPNLDKIKMDTENKNNIKYSSADTNDVEIDASKIISDKNIRTLLLEINLAGFVRQRDLIMRRQKSSNELPKLLNELQSQKLLNTEYLLECKKTSSPLTRLTSKEKLETSEIGELICPSCSSKFKNENISEGYSCSEISKKLLKQSFWMTVYVTQVLLELGINKDAILWNLSESGEEVDILVEIFGRLWIFELKDREFGSGDAYPLNYRKVRYRAEKSIIVTTEVVAKDAKKVFEELRKEAGIDRDLPVYIEGLENTKSKLINELSFASLSYANRKLFKLSEISGYDLISLVAKKYSTN